MKSFETLKHIGWQTILIVAIAILTTRLLASYVLPQIDDSFIILRYARNLAMGYGFVFNHGFMVLGVSCPLFGILEALFYMLHLPMPITVLILNIALDVVALLWGMKCLLQAEEKISSVIFGIVFALSPSLARISIGSMEVNLFLAFCLFSISLFHFGRPSQAIILASVAFFIREEAVLLVAILLALEFFQGSKRNAIGLSLLSLVTVIPGLALIYFYYGGIIPQSVLIKLGWRAPSIFYPLLILFLNDPLGIILLPFSMYGAYLALRRRGPIQTLMLWTILLTLVYCVSRSLVMPWYGEATHYSQFLFAALGLGTIIRKSSRIARIFEGRRILYAGSILAVAIWSVITWKSGPSKVRTNIYNRLEAWGRSQPLDSMSIMASDIGAVGYYTGAKIYDLDGLVWPSEARKDPEGVVRSFKPNYLFLVRSKGNYELSQSEVVQGSYIQSMTFAQDSFELPLAKAPEAWNQNYVLFEKINR